MTKHVPRAVLDKLAGKMGYTFPFEETQKTQKMAAVERLLVFDGGENESLEDDVHSFVDKNVSSHDNRFVRTAAQPFRLPRHATG